MKTRILTTLSLTMLLLTTSVAAQEAPESTAPSDLIVLEKSWRKETVDPRAANANPLKPNEDLMRVTQEQKEFIRTRDKVTGMSGGTTEPSMPAAGPKPVDDGRTIWTSYVYKIKVKNSGAKKIESIQWEYQFLDPATQELTDQREFWNKLNLSPGKSKQVEHHSPRQPTQVVSADKLDKKYRDQFTERVIIKRIVYTDGTVWQRPVD